MKIVFILTSPRSYSSLISSMIGMHPECYPMPELNFLIYKTIGEYLNKSLLNESYFKDGTLRAVAQIIFGDQTEKSIQEAKQFLQSHKNTSTQNFFDMLINRISHRIPIIKAPIYSSKLSFLKTLPSNAYFIHLVRHPFDQYNSMLNLIKLKYYSLLNKKPSKDKEILIKNTKNLYLTHLATGYEIYKKEQHNIITFLDKINPQNKYLLKSEDMIADKYTTLKQLCLFLKISTKNVNISQMLMPEKSPYAFLDPKNPLLGNDPNFLINPIMRLDKKTFSKDLNDIPENLKNLAISLGY